MKPINVLFCCMGNICRSPMAEGMFRLLVEQAELEDHISIDSAGTHADFLNSAPDPRARRAMLERGVDIGSQRARRIRPSDFERFDLILVMDSDNFDALRFVCPKGHAHKIGRLLDYVPGLTGRDIPDPYHADDSAFSEIAELIERAVAGLLERLRQN